MLTVKDLTLSFGVCEATVLRNAKAWGGFKVGREWRFPFESTNALAENLRKAQNGGRVGSAGLSIGEQQCHTREPVATTGKSESTAYQKVLAPLT